MRRYHTHSSDPHTPVRLHHLTPFRSKSKQSIHKMKEVYQGSGGFSLTNQGIMGVRIRNNTPSPTKSNDLKIKIPKKTHNHSPAVKSARTKEHIPTQQILTSRPVPIPKLEELRQKPSKFTLKLNNTQKYFKKERQKLPKGDSLTETLKMVWQKKPKKGKTQFRMLKSIAKSQAGEIIQAVSNKTGIVAAIKTFKKDQLKLEFMIDEIKIQMYCQHPNILSAYGYHIGKQEVYLVMEVGQCNLYDLLIKQAPFDETIVADFVRQVASGVAYLHSLGVMHRDIKPENIIVLGGCLKIADFGWSIRATQPRKTLCGTLDYLSPEVSHREYYNNKIDCWSIGVLMYELLTGQPPFPQQTEQSGAFTELKMPKGLSEGAKDLLSKLLEVDPVDRIWSKQIAQHEWIRHNQLLKQKTDYVLYHSLHSECKKLLQ